MLTLRIIKGPQRTGESFSVPLGESLIIGRNEDCNISLRSSGISKRHCRVTAIAGSRLEVEDLKSSNGTFVNGVMVKKHVLKAGDSLSLNEFTFQVMVKAPELAPSSGHLALNIENPGTFQSVSAAPAVEVAEVVNETWLDKNVYPLADRLSESFDIRMLLGGFFLIWSVMMIFLTASPFSEKANSRVQDQAAEVARLYARQLVRLNQQAIVEQRYRNLISDLDDHPGKTPGLVSAMILDASTAQILAPSEMFGQSLPNPFAVAAINKDSEFTQFDKDGLAYVSAPIRVGSANGNKTAATAFVVLDTSRSQFTFSALLDQVLNSLLISLAISLLFILFIYRWIDGSLGQLSARVDVALKRSEGSVSNPVKWPALQVLADQISFALGRSQNSGGSSSSHGGSGEWASAVANGTSLPAAAFTSNLQVSAWNSSMENLIGIRANLALGADISGASRDVAFETTIRGLAQQAPLNPWTAVSKEIEFNGIRHLISMVYGQEAFLAQISKVEE